MYRITNLSTNIVSVAGTAFAPATSGRPLESRRLFVSRAVKQMKAKIRSPRSDSAVYVE